MAVDIAGDEPAIRRERGVSGPDDRGIIWKAVQGDNQRFEKPRCPDWSQCR